MLIQKWLLIEQKSQKKLMSDISIEKIVSDVDFIGSILHISTDCLVFQRRTMAGWYY